MKKYVWYASYGSNISKERFLCYILGGRAIGAQTSEEGCRDKALPLKYETIQINKKQYFAKSAYRWQDKGVAFVDSKTSEDITLGYKYLITVEQFEDVVKQENKIPTSDFIDLKLDETRRQGSKVIVEDSWYGRILFLGEYDGYPIYTFTNINPFENEMIKPPSKEYLQMIGRGLYENYRLELEKLTHYFMQKSGVAEFYTFEEVKRILHPIYEIN